MEINLLQRFFKKRSRYILANNRPSTNFVLTAKAATKAMYVADMFPRKKMFKQRIDFTKSPKALKLRPSLVQLPLMFKGSKLGAISQNEVSLNVPLLLGLYTNPHVEGIVSNEIALLAPLLLF